MNGIFKFMGHGRALETWIVCFKILLGMWIIPSNGSLDIKVFSDVIWYVPDSVIAFPFIFVGTIQSIGLILNYKGVECSWGFRFVGAWLGTCIWMWLIVKGVLYGAMHTITMPLAIMGILASAFLMCKAWNRLPVPGAVGLT